MKKKTNYNINKILAETTQRGGCLARILCLLLVCICLLGQTAVVVRAESVTAESDIAIPEVEIGLLDSTDGRYELSFSLKENENYSEIIIKTSLSDWIELEQIDECSITDSLGELSESTGRIMTAEYDEATHSIFWSLSINDESQLDQEYTYHLKALLHPNWELLQEQDASSRNVISKAEVSYQTIDDESAWLSTELDVSDVVIPEVAQTTTSIKLLLVDADTESLISGAAFCLEKEVDGIYEQLEEGLILETGYNLDNLTYGTYKLIEMQEPEGYLPLEEEWILEISQEGVCLVQESDGILLTTEDGETILTIYHVRNDEAEKDLRLPSTGGNSATRCFTCGLILMLGTMLCLFLVRNTKNYHN